MSFRIGVDPNECSEVSVTSDCLRWNTQISTTGRRLEWALIPPWGCLCVVYHQGNDIDDRSGICVMKPSVFSLIAFLNKLLSIDQSDGHSLQLRLWLYTTGSIMAVDTRVPVLNLLAQVSLKPQLKRAECAWKLSFSNSLCRYWCFHRYAIKSGLPGGWRRLILRV